MPGGKSRWSQGKDLSWEPLRPELVVEVAYDHMQGSRFRHTAHVPALATRQGSARVQLRAARGRGAARARGDLRGGIGAVTFKDLFSERPDAYARYRPTYPAAAFEWLAAQTPDTKVAVDVGTGNGQAAVALADRFERVIGLDPSDAQLQNARAHPRVEYRQSSAEQLAIDDRAHQRSSPRRRCTGSSTTPSFVKSDACSCPAACSRVVLRAVPRSRPRSTPS
jgi:2-polyprenyl-3-methyl-5-hydroxy-6-metoxy-1,4-benzoquinol methylase